MELSIQELRQALRERGANSKGSKKQLMQVRGEERAQESGTAWTLAAAAAGRWTGKRRERRGEEAVLDW